MRCSLHSSLPSPVPYNCNEQVGDAGRTYLAERSQPLPVAVLEQQHAAAERLAFVNRIQRACRSEMIRFHRDLRITRFQIVHAAIEDDAAAVDEHHISK